MAHSSQLARSLRPRCAVRLDSELSLDRVNPYVDTMLNSEFAAIELSDGATLSLQLDSPRRALRPAVSAPELIKGFAETAPADVQQAVRATVISLLGNLPPHMYDTSIASTGQNVASLMYSMQMTGYMFRSAEYRRSLMESLSAAGEVFAPPSRPRASERSARACACDPPLPSLFLHGLCVPH